MVDKKYFILAQLVGILSIVQPSFAQKRITEIEPVLVSPEEGAQLIKDVPYPFHLSIKNNGPDSLIVGDTLFVNIVSAGRIYPILVEKTIPSGATVSVIESEITMTISETSPGITGDWCIQLMDAEANGIIINGQPVEVTYSDPDISNNIVCNRITVSPSSTTIKKSQEEVDNLLDIYPNPAINEVYIRYNKKSFSGSVILKIINLSGKQILSKDYNIVNITEDIVLKLDISSLNTGLYFVTLQNGETADRGTLLIHK